MKMDLRPCKKCGTVIDVETLKRLEEEKTPEKQEQDQMENKHLYANFHDFFHYRCSACGEKNQGY